MKELFSRLMFSTFAFLSLSRFFLIFPFLLNFSSDQQNYSQLAYTHAYRHVYTGIHIRIRVTQIYRERLRTKETSRHPRRKKLFSSLCPVPSSLSSEIPFFHRTVCLKKSCAEFLPVLASFRTLGRSLLLSFFFPGAYSSIYETASGRLEHGLLVEDTEGEGASNARADLRVRAGEI